MKVTSITSVVLRVCMSACLRVCVHVVTQCSRYISHLVPYLGFWHLFNPHRILIVHYGILRVLPLLLHLPSHAMPSYGSVTPLPTSSYHLTFRHSPNKRQESLSISDENSELRFYGDLPSSQQIVLSLCSITHLTLGDTSDHRTAASQSLLRAQSCFSHSNAADSGRLLIC